MNENRKVPSGWASVTLGNVGEIVSGGTPSTSIPEYWNGDINWIAPSDLSGYFNKCISTGAKSISAAGLRNSSARLMPKGSVLFSSRAPIGYVVIANSELCTNQGFKSIIPNKAICNEYLFYFLKSAKGKAEDVASGTTFKEISLSNFSQLQIPLPPISEQRRIVVKIEELFSSLDKGIESLKTSQQQLKVYRQAVLKWAFEGKFTNENVKEGELPDGWKWKQTKEITSVLGDGLHGTPVYSESGEYYFINGNNLSDGKIEIKENTKHVTIEEYEIYKKPLNENTIFVSINGTLGNTAFYNGEKVVLGKSACYFNVLNTVDKQYVRYCITSQRFINYAHKNATGSTIKNVGLKAMREFEIPLPPTIEEQQLIVAEIESRLSVCDKIEESIEQSLKQSVALRQSILKKAFEGKLVPQDPDDEPASVVLDWIKAEREKGESGSQPCRQRGRIEAKKAKS